MLYISLIMSIIVLCSANVAVTHPRRYGVGAAGLAAGSLMGVGGLAIASLPVLVTAYLLTITSIVWVVAGWPKKPFVWCAASMTALVYLAIWWAAVRPEMEQVRNARQSNPMISMDERLPIRAKSYSAPVLTAESAKRLDQLESVTGARNGTREYALRALHENAVEYFVSSPGFGVSRAPVPRLYSIERPTISSIPQPGMRDASTESELPSAPQSHGSLAEPWQQLLLASTMDFVNSYEFGYFKSRQAVAGFRPHRFSRLPNPPPRYQLQTLDLVGLVVHPQPVAYVSDNLPRMEELRKAPTRELNEFESAGLEEIKKGDDLFARESDTKLRLFGAIRATKQCTECHGCQRGDLLGAFSYVLKRSTP